MTELSQISYPENALQIMTEIRDNKIKTAEEWKRKQLELLHEVVELEEQQLKEETERYITEYREHQLADVVAQFEALMSSHKHEVEAYIMANPQREPMYKELLERSKVNHKLKKSSSQAKMSKLPVRFDEEIGRLLELVNESGVDLSTLTIFAEKAFMLKGEIFQVGERIKIATKAGTPLDAVVSNSTEFEVTFQFLDKGELVIPKEKFINGKISISHPITE